MSPAGAVGAAMGAAGAAVGAAGMLSAGAVTGRPPLTGAAAGAGDGVAAAAGIPAQQPGAPGEHAGAQAARVRQVPRQVL